MSTGTGFFTIDLLCEACGLKSWTEVPKADAIWEKRWDCPSCEASQSVKRIMSAPRVAKRALPDGYKRAGWADLKESAALEEQAFNSSDVDTRNGIKQEIKKMGIKTEL